MTPGYNLLGTGVVESVGVGTVGHVSVGSSILIGTGLLDV